MKPARPKNKPELPTQSATRLPTYPATRSQKQLTAPDPSLANPNLDEHTTQLLAEEIRHKEELMKIKAATTILNKYIFQIYPPLFLVTLVILSHFSSSASSFPEGCCSVRAISSISCSLAGALTRRNNSDFLG